MLDCTVRFDRSIDVHPGVSDSAPTGGGCRLGERAEDKKELSEQTFYGRYLFDTFCNGGIAL